MIPLRDTIPARNVPVVNYSLIGINIVIFLYQLSLGPAQDNLLLIYGLVPVRYTEVELWARFSLFSQLFAFLSFMFLHGGFWHILGNMWSLYIFGDNVEDHFGPVRYLVFYLACGIASGLSHLVTNVDSMVPTIGASGAIAGVMGAYVLLHPKAKILTLIPIIFIPWFVEIPAFFYLGIWFVLQFINAAGSSGTGGGIAWWAHIGGFVFGMVLLKVAGALPSAGITPKVQKATVRRKSHRLQVIRPSGMGEDPHLYGTITITPFEALAGTRKLVNIPWGFQRRPFRVTVPPGVKAGNKLRLKGLGKITPQGQRGDLYLKIVIQS